MKKNYTLFSALLLGLLGFQGVQAQNLEANVERIKQVLTYGDWNDAGKEFGIDTKNVPTQVKDFFYNNRGLLVKTLEGDFQLGDSPATILDIEKYGDIKPVKFTSYNYDNNDRLTSVSEQLYHSANGWFYDWNVNDTLVVYAYGNDGKLAKKSEKNFDIEYSWKDGQLVAEKKIEKSSGNLISAVHHYDFIAETNEPKKSVIVEGDAAYYIENEYNENKQLLKNTKYVLANPVKDENGIINDGEKGEPLVQTAFAYENNRLTSEVTSVWDKENNKFAFSKKKETSLNEEKGGFETIAYNFENGEWKATENPTVEIIGKYNLTAPVTEISVNEMGPKANSVSLTFNTPSDVDSEVKWNVYRNGICLGNASKLDGRWEFHDYEVVNGNYDYYVMADSVGDKTISNVVSYSFNSASEKVEKINVLESGKTQIADENGETKSAYVYRLSWKAPENKKTIMGYNIYLNADPSTGNVKPHNAQLLTQPCYDLVMDSYENVDNNVIVEIIYSTGYAQSAPFKITLNPDGDINKNSYAKVQKVVTFGNTMGGVDIATRSKEEINYYDADNKLVMSVSNGYMVGDDPDTQEIEKAGDYMPTQYTIYSYDEKGNLLSEKSREFGVFSGYDRAWSNEFVTLAAYKYDENTGKLIRKEETSKAFEYDWEGDNMVTERIYTTRGNGILGQITYSDFSDKGKNLPRYGLGVSISPYVQNYNRVYEFDYDEKGRITEKRTYKHGDNVEKDDKGMIIKADKGILYEKLTYEYEGDMLKTKIKHTYKSSTKEVTPYSKQIFTQTAQGLREQNFTYTKIGNTDAWTEASTITETVTNNYLGNTAPGQLTVTDIEGKTNCVLLTCDAPAKVYSNDAVYDIFRNGKKIGEAKANAEGKIVFEDDLVPNGTWHYIVKPQSAFDGVDYNSSNVVEKVLNTTLPVVTHLNFPINGTKDNGDYQLVAEWETPETDLDILGYNVFVDVRSFTKNPTPVNGVDELPKNTHSYEFSWMSYVNPEKTIMIETVYKLGKAKSEKFAVTLSGDPVGIVSTEQTKHLATVGNQIVVNGDYQQLSVYAANGACVGQYSNTSTVDLTSLSNGIYVVKLVTAQGVETLKVVKR